MRDIRDDILRGLGEEEVTASIIADDDGIVAETSVAEKEAKKLGLKINRILAEGSQVKQGDEIARFTGNPKQVVMAEDRLIGLMAKPSGIATATRRFVEKAGRRPQIVSGAWKKMPWSQKDVIRRAVAVGGANCRISRDPFLYLDKNYIKMLGGIKESLQAVVDLDGHCLRVVQLKGAYKEIALEACDAVEHGADIIFIDTGRRHDVKRVTDRLNRLGWRDKVKIAFGGNVRLEEIEALKELDVDILDIGRQIVDAPLLDMRLEVVDTRADKKKVEGFDLLQKTELRIERISLQGANLNDVAAAVAEVLGMAREEVLVTDVLNDVMAIDILRRSLDAYSLVGKRDRLLQRLAQIPGVGITEETSICSEGMLGWIALDEADAKKALKRSVRMMEAIRQKIAKRVIVFSTGFEVSSGQIEDTNKPTIAQRLEAEGYSVTLGPTLKDDHMYIVGHMRQAIDGGGYGLVITTGGVGAEAKDHTIEAVLALDPEAATPYICKFEKGAGRHAKDGVRIGVGKASDTLIIALPGPNDEVKRSLDILVKGLEAKMNKHDLAEQIASHLREALRVKMMHGDH